MAVIPSRRLCLAFMDYNNEKIHLFSYRNIIVLAYELLLPAHWDVT